MYERERGPFQEFKSQLQEVTTRESKKTGKKFKVLVFVNGVSGSYWGKDDPEVGKTYDVLYRKNGDFTNIESFRLATTLQPQLPSLDTTNLDPASEVDLPDTEVVIEEKEKDIDGSIYSKEDLRWAIVCASKATPVASEKDLVSGAKFYLRVLSELRIEMTAIQVVP